MMDVKICLWSMLLAILLPAFGFGLSVMAGAKGRRYNRPPSRDPGWRNRQK